MSLTERNSTGSALLVGKRQGYLSDRTRPRMGRRRPWLVCSAVPIAIVCIMMWDRWQRWKALA